jgi:hypothetical protein
MSRLKYVGAAMAAGLSLALVSVSMARADDSRDAAKSRALELRRQRAINQPTMGARLDSRQGAFTTRLGSVADQFGYMPGRQGGDQLDLRRGQRIRELPRSDFAFDADRRVGESLGFRGQPWQREDTAELDQQPGRQWSSGYGTYDDLNGPEAGMAFRGSAARDSRFGWDHNPGRRDSEWLGNAPLARGDMEFTNRDLWSHISMLEREIEHLRAHVAAIEGDKGYRAGVYGSERADRGRYSTSPRETW